MSDKEYYINQEGDCIFYVYIHRRLSDNKPFYVGKGKGKRAWQINPARRNSYWKRVKEKHGVKVEIYKDCLRDDEALKEEVKLITSLREQGFELTNLTDGGDGASGSKRTPEQVERLANSIKSKTVYTFLNLDTRKVFVGTRSEFTEYTGHHRRVADFLCNDRLGTVSRGWFLADFVLMDKRGYVSFDEYSTLFTPVLEKGQSLRKGSKEHALKNSETHKDKTIYLFAHTVTRETFKGTREDFMNKVGKNAAPLFKKVKKAATLKSWVVVLDGNVDRAIQIGLNKGYDEVQTYRFRNLNTGEEIIGTRVYFKKCTGVESVPLFKANPQKHVKGWQVIESIVEEL